MSVPGTEPGVLFFLSVVKLLILLIGAVIAYFAYKAYRRTHDRAFGMLAVGFGILTLGAFLGGAAHQLLGVGLVEGVLVESVFVLMGLTLIAYSLYT